MQTILLVPGESIRGSPAAWDEHKDRQMLRGEAGPLCLPLPTYLPSVRMLTMSERGEDNPKLKTAAASAPDEVCLLERMATALGSSCAAVTL